MPRKVLVRKPKFGVRIRWGEESTQREVYNKDNPFNEYEFPTLAELNAFLKGCEEASGWMDYTGVENQDKPIKAEAHSDDHAVQVDFDARKWFEQATNQEILDLAKCEWGGDYPADAVAEFMADSNRKLAKMFTYVEIAHETKDIGFECHVDEESALNWLELFRPDLFWLISDGQFSQSTEGDE